MVKKLVRYRLRLEATDRVRTAIRELVASVAREEPDTIYAAMVADDGVSYTHAMAFPDAAAEERHRHARHTRAFLEMLHPNCEAPPEFMDVQVLASTRERPGGFLGRD